MKKIFNEMSVLFPLLTIYTIVYMGLMIYDFVAKEAFAMPDGMMVAYVALLGAYVADKELRRWLGKDAESKKGSIFVYLWMLFFLVTFAISSFKKEYVLPADLSKVALQVLGVFFGSKASKKIYEGKSEKEVKEALSKQDTIIEMIKSKGQVTRKEVQDKLSVSSSTAGRILDEMESKGLVEQIGQYKDTKYVIKTDKDE